MVTNGAKGETNTGDQTSNKELYKTVGMEKSLDNLRKHTSDDDLLSCVSGITNPIKKHMYTNENADAQSLLSGKVLSMKMSSMRSKKSKKAESRNDKTGVVNQNKQFMSCQAPAYKMNTGSAMIKLMKNAYANGTHVDSSTYISNPYANQAEQESQAEEP